MNFSWGPKHTLQNQGNIIRMSKCKPEKNIHHKKDSVNMNFLVVTMVKYLHSNGLLFNIFHRRTTLFSFYKDPVYKDIRLGFCHKLRKKSPQILRKDKNKEKKEEEEEGEEEEEEYENYQYVLKT